ncbi:Hypothetical Protein FCC1311_079052 [Hondaea fermentalgiana]|uniref:Uncharacterized protein n=1 Tax=Hondaea fermentalgiana TaxID=2315210 RepID=A0A2R5GLC8_9STRA|nr:Hypothetical Protein FCC1311_079052 [Hondaea fermentalgiana]|eukprot:GBG31680.1 Hypothetical Protein FCC1311_079052 [Hondaea fermentalgiana]
MGYQWAYILPCRASSSWTLAENYRDALPFKGLGQQICILGDEETEKLDALTVCAKGTRCRRPKKIVSVDVGLNYFEISDVGIVRARDLDAFAFHRVESAVRCSVTPRWTGTEEIFALQFPDTTVAIEAETKLRDAAQSVSAFEGDLEISDQELVTILMDPGFVRVVDQVTRLLYLVKMSFMAALPSLEKQLLIYGVGGYSVCSLLYSVTHKPAAAEKQVEAPAAPKESPKEAVKDIKEAVKEVAPSGSSFKSGSSDAAKDPAVLFALQDIQSRLSVIEKALHVEE